MKLPRAVAWLGLGAGIVYLLNPGWGIWEFIPDNIPGFGNLDEAAAFALVLWGWRRLRSGSPEERKEKNVTPRENS
jgi:uncharacterized membrane protein YkvA (DUF1232 family)